MSNASKILRENIVEVEAQRDWYVSHVRLYSTILARLKALEASLTQANDKAAGERGETHPVQQETQASELRQGGSEDNSDYLSGCAPVQPVGVPSAGQSSSFILLRSEDEPIYGPCACDSKSPWSNAPMALHGPESAASVEASKDHHRADESRGYHEVYCFGASCWAKD